MKLKHFLPIFYCLFFSKTYAQQNNTLRGKILYLNSAKTPAIGVKISGKVKGVGMEHANVQYTTSKGSFELVFPAKRDGHQVNLVIGAEDELGQAIEVVNDKEVEICRIPAIANEEFEIIVCPKGARDLVAKRYYNIIKTSADLALEEKQMELDSLLSAKEKNYEQITTLSEQIGRLKKQTDSLVIYRTAWRIASINKDKAGERVLKYIAALDSGKTIQEALEYLSVKLAGKQAGEAINAFYEAIEELVLLADGSLFASDYKNALAYYDTILLKLQLIDKNPLTIAGYLDKASMLALKAGQDSTALNYSLRAQAIYVEFLHVNHPELGTCYFNLATAYKGLGANTLAIQNYEKAAMVQPNIKKLTFYSNLGIVYTKNEQYKKAFEVFTDCEKLYPDESDTFRNWAMYYALQNQKAQAITHLQKAIDLGFDGLEWLKTDDSMDGLRKELAFIELVKQLEKADRQD